MRSTHLIVFNEREREGDRERDLQIAIALGENVEDIAFNLLKTLMEPQLVKTVE